ncbi:nectin-2 isoform X2 [Salmo salar]|uniref:Nectin cell adhesion molecule 3 n=1 Tax=Salmo salar TaxID=8030 RepID=A0A1S3RW36_SALSA|nr:nectin-2 isoform X2 [Salmo salar]|eukprot:XP_014056485.1 PREDICTED: nectin-2-like isoform X2 [Salmo salar]
MARKDARNKHDFTNIIGLFSVVTLLTFQGALSQQVKVEPEVMSYPSQAVNLRCAFADAGGIQLTQVSWIYEPKEGERLNIAVFHPKFGASYPTSPLKGRVRFTTEPPSLSNPSIQISDVKMTDEGKYICEYATYPSGNEQGVTSLIMLAKPRNSASGVTVIASTVAAGAKPVVVARCESADGRPAAQITWVTAVNGNATSASTAGADNTVTVSSQYMLVPTAADNGKDISCLVSHRTQAKPESFLMKLAIEYPPQVTIVGYDDNWYMGRTNVALTCQATANPIPTTITWKTMTGQMPDTVQVKENVLTVLKVDEQANTTFVCEVKNRLGTGKDQVTVMVRGTRLPVKGPATGAVIGGLIGLVLLLAIIGSVVVLVRKKRSQHNGDGPPKYKPPPPKKQQSTTTSSSSDTLNTSRDPVERKDGSMDHLYYTPQDAEPSTDLDAYSDEELRYAGAPSGWDEPRLNEVPPLYAPNQYKPNDYHDNEEDHPPAAGATRGESFVSQAMFV